MSTQRCLVLASMFTTALTTACAAESGAVSATGTGTDGVQAADAGPEASGDHGGGNGSAMQQGPGETDAGEQRGELCEELTIRATPREPDIMIVLDRSESMEKDTTSGFPVQTMRWEPAVTAVKQVTAALDTSVRFGLMVFPNEASRCSSGLLEVPLQLGAAPAVATRLDATSAGGATPLSITLRGAENELLSERYVPDAVTRDQYILLITDGAPNCSATLPSSNDPDDADAYKAVDSLLTNNIQTYVVGFDTGGLEVLNELARRGGTGDTMHRQVSDAATLVAELEEIAKQVVSCTYALEAAPGDPLYVRVEIDGKSYPLGEKGWQLEGDTTIQLQPSACTVLQDGKQHTVAITVECEPVVVI